MRLIDADAFREELCKHFAGYGTHENDTKEDVEWNEDLAWFIEKLDNQPTIEPAEDWIPFKLRALTDEEREEYPPEITGIWCEPLPDHGQDILVSDGKYVWDDTFFDDDYCYLDGGTDIEEGMAWMPMPKAYRPKEAAE